jgi:beta-lactamase regulating signal transducer with metallopeptidase domain
MTELLTALLQANLAASAAIVVVLAARRPLRAAFGARLAYGLWLLAPLAATASLLPPRAPGFLPAPPVAPAPLITSAERTVIAVWDRSAPALGSGAPLDPALTATIIWIAGALTMVGWLALKQRQFTTEMAQGVAGPAVVGVLAPRIVTPADFEERFDRRERAVVLAHEEAHLAGQDARINALAALVRCICWFNPLVHAAAYLMRIDQELACDAAVIARHPKAKGAYAQALLKAQLAARPLPLGCYWRAGTEHPLMERLKMLERPNPSPVRRLAGGALIGVLSAGAGYAAWASTPAVAPIAAAPIAYAGEFMATASQAVAPQPPGRQSIASKTAAVAPVRRTLIEVGRFKSEEVDFGRIVRIAEDGDERIADVRMAAPTRVLIIGKGYGETKVKFHDADGHLVTIADIRVARPEPIPYVGSASVPLGQDWERYFDPTKPVAVTGRVLEVRLTDEARSELIVEQDVGGGKARFRVSMPDPVNLTPDWKTGLKMLPGSAVQVRGYQAHDRTCEGGGCLMNGVMILSPPPPAGAGSPWPPVSARSPLSQP